MYLTNISLLQHKINVPRSVSSKFRAYNITAKGWRSIVKTAVISLLRVFKIGTAIVLVGPSTINNKLSRAH